MKSLSSARLFATPWIVACTKLLCPWDFQGESTGVGCHILLQGILTTQGTNPGLSHYRQTLYHLSHQLRRKCRGLHIATPPQIHSATHYYYGLLMWWAWYSWWIIINTLLLYWEGLEGSGAGGDGDDRGWDGWMASLTRWTWVWVKSGSWWWTRKPGVLLFMGSQRIGHNWTTELNWSQC